MKCTILGTILWLVVTANVLGQDAKPAPSQGGGKSTSDGNCGMVYGKTHAFNLCAPKGWVLDNTIGNQDGIYAAFYPAESSWNTARDSGTVMYVNTALQKGEDATVAGLMATDVEDTKRNAPSAVAKEGDAIKLDDTAARVQFVEHGGFDRFEAVAYVDSPKTIVMFVMTSNNEQSFKRDYPRLSNW
jgi:hypothetical protein